MPVDSLFHQATCPSSGYFGQNVCQETEGSYMKHREGRDLLSALHSSIGQSWRVGRALCALCEEKQCLFPTESISKPYGCGLLRWVEPPGPGWVDWVTLPFGPRVEMDIARCTEIKRRPIGRPIGCGPSVRPMARLTTRAPRSNPEVQSRESTTPGPPRPGGGDLGHEAEDGARKGRRRRPESSRREDDDQEGVETESLIKNGLMVFI